MSGRKHVQVFRKEYAEQWPVLTRSMKSSHHAFCTVCKTDFSIAHGGRSDCLRHVDGARHRQNGQAVEGCKSIRSMFASSTNDNRDLIKAECLFTKFIIEHNLPISIADHAGPLFQRMFPDSKLSSKYKCARTKTTEIIKSFAQTSQKDLYEIVKSNKFSLATDGSNSIANEKLFPLIITYFNEEIGKVSTVLLSLLKLEDDATGKNIFSLIESEFEKNNINWFNCVAFCADNASVMLGEHKGVGSYIRKKNPNIVIHGCACHLIHLAAQHAAKKLTNFDVEGFLIDVYYYLKKSTKRMQLLKICEEACELENRKILKYGSTRWLSMGKVIDRFLEQWAALKKFFCEEEKGTSSTFIRTKEKFQCPLTKPYLLFLQSVIPIFLSANVMMQQEAPLVHKYQRELRNLFNSVLSRFIKPSAILKASTIFKIDVSKRCNQKEDSELVIGAKARQFIKDSNLTSKQIDNFYSDVRNFYGKACLYMREKFPLEDEIYEHCEVADIRKRDHVKFASVDFFLNLFFIPEVERSNIEEEFAVYQVDPLDNDILTSEHCDEAWTMISKFKDHNGAQKYKFLPSLMKSVLLLPHSNAACERIFSIVKKNLTEYRSSMNIKTLEALMIEKSKSFAVNETCFTATFSEKDLVLAKQATFQSLHTEKELD